MPLKAFILFCLLQSPLSIAAETLQLSQAWIRATPPNARVAGAFLQIANTGIKPDRLLSASTDAAAHIEIHEMRLDGEVMQMRELKAGLLVPAKSSVELKPGGIHMMLIGPKRKFVEGNSIVLTLVFEQAGKRTVNFNVYKQLPAPSAISEHRH